MWFSEPITWVMSMCQSLVFDRLRNTTTKVKRLSPSSCSHVWWDFILFKTIWSLFVCLSYTIWNFQKPKKNVRCVCKYIFFYLICRWNEYMSRIKGIQFAWYYKANTLAISSDWNYVIFPFQNYVIYMRLFAVSLASSSKILC